MDRVRSSAPVEGRLPDADARLLEQIRSGDAGAGHCFVGEHYPAVYRYLLYLTGKPELAEDLTQETFLQGWRRLDTFQGQGALRTWLLRIARREFLQALRRQRAQASLEEIGDVAAPDTTAWTDAVALREAIDRLPLEQREVVLLHYLEGYTSTEIAQIVRAPAGTVRYRLARAREHLRQELGEGDLTYLNEPLAPMRPWAWLPLDQMQALEARLARGGEATKEEEMRRREFLRHTAAGAVGLMLPEQEVVDGRLTQRVTLAFKGTALSDVCDHLQSETGVRVTAGSSVADEKVTVFCEKMPLRDVMRQLSRPFGYAWLRSGTAGEYRYELVQDMRSQLLEEELRSRDRNAALLALDREMARYRAYLGLSPEDAEARARTASPNEKPLLENLSRYGWGPVQMYFRLSAHELAALRAGQTLVFSAAPRPGEQQLPPDVARGVLQGLRNWRVARDGEAFYLFASHWWDKETPDVPPRTEDLTDVAPPASRSQVRVRVDLSISQSELGRLAFGGGPQLFTTADYPVQRHAPRGFDAKNGPNGPWAIAANPLVLQPDNETKNARLAHDPALRTRVIIRPQPSCSLEPYPGPLGTPRGGWNPTGDQGLGPRVTSADVLEALHQATGLPIVSDYYTRLYKPEDVSVGNQPLFDALNLLADTMRLRWDRDKEGGWLRFRSTSFYDDRLKEVPNRLLTRWSTARRQRGYLSLDDLTEIAQLPDAQLDAVSMAEGARACFGLTEWELARHPVLRPHLRYLAGFTPAQRQEAMSETGLLFTKMPLAQQQGFIAHAIPPTEPPLASLDELAGSALWIDYTQPGWFEWVTGYGGPWQTWLMPVGSGPQGQRAPRPKVRERTREAALRALRRVERKLRAGIWESRRRDDSNYTPPVDEAAEIQPTTLDLVLIYIPGASHKRPIRIFAAGLVSCQWTE